MKISKYLIILASTVLLNNTTFATSKYTFDKDISNELAWTSAYMYHHDSKKYCLRAPTFKEMLQIRNELTGDKIKASRFFSAMDYNSKDKHISKKEIEDFVKENCNR